VMDPGEKERIFTDMVERNGRWIRWIVQNHASGASRQDLSQEIFMALWESLERFDGLSSPQTWVYAVARNTAVDFRRKNRNQRMRDAAAPPPGEGVEQELDVPRILEDFLETLGALDQQIFLMYLDDLSYAEMASITGVGEANLRKRLSRIREKFKAR